MIALNIEYSLMHSTCTIDDSEDGKASQSLLLGFQCSRADGAPVYDPVAGGGITVVILQEVNAKVSKILGILLLVVPTAWQA